MPRRKGKVLFDEVDVLEALREMSAKMVVLKSRQMGVMATMAPQTIKCARFDERVPVLELPPAPEGEMPDEGPSPLRMTIHRYAFNEEWTGEE